MRRAFPGYGPDVDAKYQRSAQWLLATIYGQEKAREWCKANGVAIAKATGEGIGSAGGFIVPTDLANAILDVRDSFGAFRRRARLVPMSSDTMHVGRHPGGTNAFFTGENAAATESTANPDGIALTAKKIGTLIRISSELEEDAVVDIVDYVASEIGLAFAAKEDDCAFNGDGTSAYGRMRGVGTIVLDGAHAKAKVTAGFGNTYLTIDFTDLSNLMASVQASSIPNAAWFCSQTCFAQALCRLAGAAHLPMAMVDGVLTPYFLGFPVILTQKMPLGTGSLSGQAMIVFGDMYLAGVLGQRRGITLARSGERYLDQDEIAVLGTERFHAVVHDLGDNSNFGAVAALVAP
jgi:HK97 family phage major capsid protein